MARLDVAALGSAHVSSTHPKTALVYRDQGADPFVTDCLIIALRPDFERVQAIDAAMICTDESVFDEASLFAIPGGADRPYADKLNGLGNERIGRYVRSGGRLLAVCAGAYYACRRIDFTGADFAVKSPRELALFPGTAVGSMEDLAAPYRMGDLRCAAATPITFSDEHQADVLYWGGCRFVADANESGFDVIARYSAVATPANAAAVRCAVGDGVAVLVGVHAEVTGVAFDRERFDGNYPSPDSPHALATAERLREQEPSRQRLWRTLISSLDV